MGILADVVFDRHILDGFTITGLLLGVLGSLYLAYDLLRPQKTLQKLTRMLTVGLMWFFLMMALYGMILGFSAGSKPSLRFLLGVSAGFGVIIGVLVGFIAVSPESRPAFFSRKKFLRGMGFAVFFCLGALSFLVSLEGATGLLLFFGGILIIGIAAGFLDRIVWWADQLTERRLGVIGVFLILFGFILALAQPLADILDLPVH